MLKIKKNLFAEIAITFFLLINIVPNFQASAYIIYINLISYILLLLYNIKVCTQKGIKGTEVIAYFLIIFACSIPLLTGNKTIFNRYVQLSILPISYLLYIAFLKENKLYILRDSSKFVLSISVINLLISLYYVRKRPSIMRGINVSNARSFSNMRKGIGGYDLIYFTLIILIYAFFIWLFERKKIGVKDKVKVFCYIGVGGLAIAFSNFLTALMILALACVILGFLWLVYKRKYLLLLVCIFSLGVVFVLDNWLMDYFAPIILKMVPGGATALRIETYRGQGIFKAIITEFLADRMPLIKQSFLTAKDTWFFGSLFAENKNMLDTIGQHSYLMDTMALHGGLVFILNCVILLFPFLSASDKEKKILYFVEFVSCCFLLLLNNATASIALGYYVFVPALSQEEQG